MQHCFRNCVFYYFLSSETKTRLLTLVSLLLRVIQANDIVSYVTPSYAHHAVGTQSQSVVRSLDGKSVHSVYSKAVDTPFSSVRKYDSRLSNDAVAYAHAHAPFVAPVKSYAPVTYTLKAYTAPYPYTASLVNSFASPVIYHAPVATTNGVAYHAPVGSAYPYHTGSVAYSSAAVVSHVDFDGYGVHYAF
uniref:Larval/pupal cuticle protein H1C n=1 Tax=Cacopsylla melanoneura TaxID=428564 RepID=A0A8D8Q6Q5_9HEMI